jgi:hypothetical protein
MKIGKHKRTGKKVNWVKLCDNLWADIIKAKAGYKSEYSGKLGKQAGGDEILNSHHMVGKPNYRLRYEFDNGICLTGGEHTFIAHHTGRQEMFRERVKQIRGEDIYDRLNLLRNSTSKDIRLTYLFLLEESRKIK